MKQRIISIDSPWLGAVGVLLLGGLSPVFAQAGKTSIRCLTVEGALLAQTANGKWENVKALSPTPTDRLLVALFKADFASGNGAVQARLLADIGQRGPFPVLEAAARFHAATDVDLELSLERGIVGFLNKRKKGAAKVRLRIRGEPIEVTLGTPGAKLGVEIYGRHLPGAVNVTDPKADDPVASLAFFALNGEIVLSTKKHTIRLNSPPGPALLLWDSVTRMPDVHRFETLPDSFKPHDTKELKMLKTINAFARAWSAKPVQLGLAVEKSTASANPLERKTAVVALGALDELPRLIKVLGNEKFADTRDISILVLRHWLGREPGQSVRFFDHLTKKEKLTPTQAKNFMSLLNGFDAEKMRDPETYQVLIDALSHKRVEVRELARWHLVRMAPVGQKIGFDAAAPDAERREAIAAWRRLIPPGELPAAPKKSESSN